jgi:hypothetical protein
MDEKRRFPTVKLDLTPFPLKPSKGYSPEKEEKPMNGSIQTDTPELVLHEVEGGAIHYTVQAKVVPSWGMRPKPGAVHVLTKGITHDTLSELRERVVSLWGVGVKDGFWHYEGPQSGWPYLAR